MSNLVGPPLEASQRLSELITERLLGLMRSGHLQERSKLPPERELAEMLGVSRTMVREALSALQLAGLVERRPGRGTVVIKTPASTVELGTYIEASASIAEVLDARMAIELGVVHLLCDNRTYDFREVVALLDVMRIAVREEHKPELYLSPSLDFHLALARAAERPAVTSIAESLIEQMRPHMWLLVERYDLALAQKSLALHEQMFAAIRSRDVVSALAQVKSHYAPYPVTTITSATRGDVATETGSSGQACC